MKVYEYIKTETDIDKLKTEVIKILDFYNQKYTEATSESNLYQFIIDNISIEAKFKHVDSPKVSIVIPVYNQYILTKSLLFSIYKNTKDIDYEIIIADDNSDDETKNIGENFENIIHIKNTSGHKGFLYNVKNAIQHARGEYIFLMNNDMITCDNYLTELLNIIENDNSIGIAGSKILTTNHKIQECGLNLYKNGLVFIGQNENITYYDNVPYIDCDYCSGCAILFRKDIWDKSGGFDTNYAPAYFEDSDFALNLKHNYNLKSVCVPKSKIYHFRGKSYKFYNLDKNKEYFLKKWDKYLTKN